MAKVKSKEKSQKNVKAKPGSSNKRSAELTDEELGKIAGGATRTSPRTGAQN